jgi:hypothetical protein
VTWLRKNDLQYDDPRVRAVGNAAFGAYHRMELFAAAQGTNGWISADKAREILSPGAAGRRELAALLAGLEQFGALLHQLGDDCACLRDHVWSEARGGYWVHDFLALNPSKSEVDVHKAQAAERRNAKLKHAVRVRDQDICRYCGKHCKHSDRVSDDGLTFDHVDPEVADGMANLVVACRGCNRRKNKRTPAQADMDLRPTPTTVAGLVTGLGTGLGTGPSQVLSQVVEGVQVPGTHGRDGTGNGVGRTNPYLRQHTKIGS